MDARVAPLAEIFAINGYLFNKAFDDMCEGDLYKRPDDRGNSVVWLAGHIVGARYLLANLLRINEEYPHAALFNRGAKPAPADQLPAPEELRKLWNGITARVTAKLETVTDEELRSTCPMTFPTKDESILSGIAFLALHESYHIGQIGYARKVLGYASVVA